MRCSASTTSAIGPDALGTVTPLPIVRSAGQVGFDRAELTRILDRPDIRIEKRPSLRMKQGIWALVGEGGATLKRGHELAGVLAPLERRLLKLVV